MAKLFGYDNPVWKVMGRVADFFFLTLLWVLFSFPLFTIGASTTALYYVSLKLTENKEGYIFRSFWKAFKENFIQTTVLWIIMAVIGTGLFKGLHVLYQSDMEEAVFFFWLLFVLTLLYLFMLSVLFPLAARLDTGIGNLFLMTFMVSLKNFSWILLMTVLSFCVIIVGVFVFWPILLIAAGAIGYVNSQILIKIIFPKYNWNSKDQPD